MFMGFMEETRELHHALEVINSVIRRKDSDVRLVYKDNPDFSVKLDRPVDLIIVDSLVPPDDKYVCVSNIGE